MLLQNGRAWDDGPNVAELARTFNIGFVFQCVPTDIVEYYISCKSDIANIEYIFNPLIYKAIRTSDKRALTKPFNII